MTRTDLIKRAIESAECRLYKVRARESYSIDHQQKAENQTEIMDITIEALEKQIPKKPKEYEDKYYGCPNCSNALLRKWEKYPTVLTPKSYGLPFCLNCGQKLDWSEEE